VASNAKADRPNQHCLNRSISLVVAYVFQQVAKGKPTSLFLTIVKRASHQHQQTSTMKTSTVATLLSAALFWLSCSLTTAATNLRSSSSQQSTTTQFIRPHDRNLSNKVSEEDPRIVNGWDAIQGAYPYYVRWGGCGGSLIAPNYVLTAGHCGAQSTSSLRVGAYTQDGNDGEYRNIVSRTFHPQYADLKFDFLLLELDDAVSGPYAILNQDESVPAQNEELQVVGLGRLNYQPGDKPDVLQEVIVPNHDLDYCNNAYSGFNQVTMLCAGNTTYDSCVGDSGGPIMTQSGVQVGLTSFGDDCAKEGKPGVSLIVVVVLMLIHS